LNKELGERAVELLVEDVLFERFCELENLIKDQRAMLRIRLNAIYRLGGQGLARILFSSTDSAQLERNLKILGIIAKRDLALMKDYSRDVDELAQKQAKFLNRLALLKTAQKKVASQEAAITAESVSKARILDSIRKSDVKTLAKLRKMRDRGIKVGLEQDDELLDLLLKPSFFEKKGSLPSPVKGNVDRRFGFWKDPTYEVTLNHKGLFFHADPKASVNAVFPGKVAFLGEVDGFGNTMILDHGDHYYSVYSGLTDVQAKAGVEIREGQKIASVNEGLYFEIRHFSEPYDPQQWMKGTQP
jgi:septal ring factor EnvC (AmiA/AmiB activator)